MTQDSLNILAEELQKSEVVTNELITKLSHSSTLRLFLGVSIGLAIGLGVGQLLSFLMPLKTPEGSNSLVIASSLSILVGLVGLIMDLREHYWFTKIFVNKSKKS
jgi:hypothetical protein